MITDHEGKARACMIVGVSFASRRIPKAFSGSEPVTLLQNNNSNVPRVHNLRGYVLLVILIVALVVGIVSAAP